ncbi:MULTISPECIES: YqkE family protein [Bacillati]|jgi:hypothetical protein|uniref:DUF3886 domain-containing protein n=1 Tax=Brevibacillus borstelensis AK1 TaxID=1300222 RepID=M8DB62_9BACL|nr:MULTISPECIES: YqkE family protein [Terrabacteria group]EMT50628.1 hypothetical protein I532_21210 [Brevibacillus borstelensis AK1]KKX56243.1 hypothetical protein X546_06005 [Brevibacillus borstelensis cifa_chp40]MBE5395478.1 YqkE family protein [Brevibacillus borstelensis]MCC0564595.1 YqkE family protein [Brevibacillus borstelensis]MCM3470508.1 YqkE family protein [Brevibacillus borstelensis]
MAKKQRKQERQAPKFAKAETPEKNGVNVKEMLSDDALGKLKQLERQMKEELEKAEQAAAERKRREQEERERNKSFGELLEEYEKKGGGKYS